MNTKFETKPKKRRDNENIYLSTKALNGKPLVLGSVDLILYRNDVLKETNEDETNCEWELIAFYGIPKCLSELPMGPVTMMRNQLCLPEVLKENIRQKNGQILLILANICFIKRRYN